MGEELMFSECSHSSWHNTNIPGRVACADGCGTVRSVVPEMSMNEAKAIVRRAMRRVYNAGFSVWGFDDGSVYLARSDNIGRVIDQGDIDPMNHD